MKRFAMALTALLTICAAGSAVAQDSVAEQMQALRERRAGVAPTTAPAPAQTGAAPAEQASGGGAKDSISNQMQVVREQAIRERNETSELAKGILAKTKNCIACHQVDTKVVGPSYREMAARYTDADLDMLADGIRNGSRGKWGKVFMPSNKRVSEEEARILAAWILKMR